MEQGRHLLDPGFWEPSRGKYDYMQFLPTCAGLFVRSAACVCAVL